MPRDIYDRFVDWKQTRRRHGLTLIELIVVVAVLAILAGLLLPRLAFMRTMSVYVAESTALQDVCQNLLAFHATQAKWPDHFDSLLTSTSGGTPAGLYGSGGGAQGLDSSLTATSGSSGSLLQTTTLTTSQLKSLNGLLGQPSGSTTTLYVMDHDESNVKPGNSGVFPRNIEDGSSSLEVATINPTHNPLTATSDPNGASGSVIYNSVYPNGNPNNEVIVALGVGPSCTAVSKTIVNPPQIYLKDATRYNRVIVLIRVRPDGVQASLASAITPDGRTLDQCLGNYRVTAER